MESFRSAQNGSCRQPKSTEHQEQPELPQSKRVETLKVYRVDEGSLVYARFLTDTYGGCFTHYTRGISRLCGGRECNPLYHKFDKCWKGYTPVYLYDREKKKWIGKVLEITENLELDLRGRLARGQVWELFRHMPVQGKAQPVEGRMVEEHPPESFPPIFDIRPTLLHLYHVDKIDLNYPNPLPPRSVIEEDDAPPPVLLQNGQPIMASNGKIGRVMSLEEMKAFRQANGKDQRGKP